MTAEVIDGRKIAQSLKADVARKILQLAADGIPCGLATLAIGHDYGAASYQRRLERTAGELSVPYRHIALADASQPDEVRAAIGDLNADPSVTGIVVLRPLPRHVPEADVFCALAPVKDIEAVHPQNAGLLALGTPRYVPSTPAAVFHLLDAWLDSAGEDRADFYHRSLITVVGRSNNVGKPAVSLAYDREAAVESVDAWASRAGRLGWHTRRADVLIVAAGCSRPDPVGAHPRGRRGPRRRHQQVRGFGHRRGPDGRRRPVQRRSGPCARGNPRARRRRPGHRRLAHPQHGCSRPQPGSRAP